MKWFKRIVLLRVALGVVVGLVLAYLHVYFVGSRGVGGGTAAATSATTTAAAESEGM